MSDFADEEVWYATLDAVLYAVGKRGKGLADEAMLAVAREAYPTLTSNDFHSAIGWLAGTRRIEPDGGWDIEPPFRLFDLKWRLTPDEAVDFVRRYGVDAPPRLGIKGAMEIVRRLKDEDPQA